MQEVSAGGGSRAANFFASAICVLILGGLCHAAPVIEVLEPGNGSSSGSPVFYEAAASSASCKSGIAAMRIYSAPFTPAYTTFGGHIETFIKLAPGNYDTVVEAWDNCGGVATAHQAITVSDQAGVTVFNNFPVLSTPVHVAASAQSPACAAGINAMRVYVAPYTAPYTVYGNTVDTYLNLPVDTQPDVVVQAWDNCGHVLKTDFNEYVQTSGDRWVYAADGLNAISQFGLTSPYSGILTIPGGGEVAPEYVTGANPSFMVGDPGGWFLYTTTGSGFYGYQVDYETGKLFPVPGSPYHLGLQYLIPLGMDTGGNFLYVANYDANTMTEYRIDRSSGALTPVTTVSVAAQTVSVTSDYTGQYVYAYGSTPPPASSEFVGYRLNQTTGALTAIPGSPFVLPQGGDGPVVAAKGYIYGGTAQELYGFAVNYSTGRLTAVPGQPAFLSPGGIPGDLASDIYGRYLWFGEVYGESVPRNGAMQPLQIGANGTVQWDGSLQDAGDHYYTSLMESYTGNYVYGGGAQCTTTGCVGSVKSWTIEANGHLATDSGPFTTANPINAIVVVRQPQQ